MNIVRVKVDDTGSQFVNFTYDITTDTWKVLVQVPDTTSYEQPDNKYGLIFEAEDEDGHFVRYDRTDTTHGDGHFGKDLVVRVREHESPAITWLYPLAPLDVDILTIEFDITDTSGGSGVDLSTIKVKFGDMEYDNTSPYLTITEEISRYKYHCVFETDYTFQDCSFAVTLEAKDYDGNYTIIQRDVTIDTDPCEFITDRTQADVDLVKALRAKYIDGTITEAEKLLYATDLKGARNRSDFERILTATEYLAGMFGLEYTLTSLPDIPRETYVQDLVDYVDMMRRTLPVHDDTPNTPVLPINSWDKMNRLEKILFDIHENLKYRFNYYCSDEEGLYDYTEFYTYESRETEEGYIPEEDVIGAAVE